MPSGPWVMSGSSGCSGMKTVPLPPLLDQVEAVIEELAEQREPRIERRRETFVRRNVGDRQGYAFGNDATEIAGRRVVEVVEHAPVNNAKARVDKPLHRGRVGDGLIDN